MSASTKIFAEADFYVISAPMLASLLKRIDRVKYGLGMGILATVAVCPWGVADSERASQQVKVGAYINDIQNLDLSTHSYSIDIYIWFKWKDSNIDPSGSLEFINPFELWGHTLTKNFEKPKQLPSGEYYQVVRNLGRFSKKLDLSRYPYDSQQLEVILEDSNHEYGELEFVADDEPVSVNPDIQLPGFNILKPELLITKKTYPSQFGDPTLRHNQAYSRVQFILPIARPALAYTVKLILPVLCVIFCAALIFFLHPSYVDSRVGIGITALLTVVALQLTLNEDLPDVAYLVLMDKIYIATYLFVISSLAVVVSNTWLEKKSVDRVMAVDRKSLIILLSTYLVGVLALALKNLYF